MRSVGIHSRNVSTRAASLRYGQYSNRESRPSTVDRMLVIDRSVIGFRVIFENHSRDESWPSSHSTAARPRKPRTPPTGGTAPRLSRRAFLPRTPLTAGERRARVRRTTTLCARFSAGREPRFPAPRAPPTSHGKRDAFAALQLADDVCGTNGAWEGGAGGHGDTRYRLTDTMHTTCVEDVRRPRPLVERAYA